MAARKEAAIRTAGGVAIKRPSTFQQYKTLLRKDLEQELSLIHI